MVVVFNGIVHMERCENPITFVYFKCVDIHSVYKTHTHTHIYIYKVNQSHYRPEVARGFQEVKVPRLRDSGPGWWEGCQPYAPAAFTPRKFSWYSFLLEAESSPG